MGVSGRRALQQSEQQRASLKGRRGHVLGSSEEKRGTCVAMVSQGKEKAIGDESQDGPRVTACDYIGLCWLCRGLWLSLNEMGSFEQGQAIV